MFLLTARFAPRRKENLKMATGSGNTSVVIGCSLKTKQAIHLKKELSPTLRIESVTYSGSCLSMFLIDFYEVVPLRSSRRKTSSYQVCFVFTWRDVAQAHFVTDFFD